MMQEDHTRVGCSPVRVKICGLQDEATIQALDGLPIDEIGFVFAKSRREVKPALAAELIRAVKKLSTPSGGSPRTVGVLVNADLVQIKALLAEAPLDVVQLHGGESPELCAEIRQQCGVEVWKVFSITPDEHAPQADAATSSAMGQNSSEQQAAIAHGAGRLTAYKDKVDAVLIDTAGGGTGHTFAWHVIDSYAREAERMGVPLYVAGGLQPDNVSELLVQYSPGGVDVSSGVETEGHKDVEKIKRFVERVKYA